MEIQKLRMICDKVQGAAAKAHPPEQRSWYFVQRIAASFAGSQSQSDSSADAGTQGRRKSGLQRQNQCCKMVYHQVIHRRFQMRFCVQLATNLKLTCDQLAT